MNKKLSTANPYLRDPVQRERAVLQSVASSSAIEGIHAPFRHRTSSNGNIVTTSKPAAGRKSGITR